MILNTDTLPNLSVRRRRRLPGATEVRPRSYPAFLGERPTAASEPALRDQLGTDPEQFARSNQQPQGE